MSTQDAHPKGGDLSDMAVEGTTVPADSATQRTIPSVPRPNQVTEPTNDPNNYGSADLAGAADNAGDISRSTKDTAPSADIITGTGDSLPTDVGAKRLHNVASGDVSKGHPRYDKHVRQKGSELDEQTTDAAAQEDVVDGVVGGR